MMIAFEYKFLRGVANDMLSTFSKERYYNFLDHSNTLKPNSVLLVNYIKR